MYMLHACSHTCTCYMHVGVHIHVVTNYANKYYVYLQILHDDDREIEISNCGILVITFLDKA